MVLPAAMGLATVGIIFVYNAKVTGSWSSFPWSVWAREYIPSDAPGFGLDPTPPGRELPHVMAMVSFMLGMLALAPGMPFVPFATLAGLIGVLAVTVPASALVQSGSARWRRSWARGCRGGTSAATPRPPS